MLQEGLESPTLGLLDQYSPKLSCQSTTASRSGSNQRPSQARSDVQPTELYGHIQCKSLKLEANWNQKGIGLKLIQRCRSAQRWRKQNQWYWSGVREEYYFFLHIMCKALWNCVTTTTWMLPVKTSELPLASSQCGSSESSAQAILWVLSDWGQRCQIS